MSLTILAVDGRSPQISGDAWVAPNAIIVGSATIGAGTGVFYGAVIRADMEDISVGEGSNVQDTAVVHADPGHPARVGNHVSVGHGAVLHGCTVGDGALIGMNATVLNGAIIGAGSLVAANALVLEGTEVPPGSLVAGVPAKVRRPLTPEEIEHCRQNAATYAALTLRHRDATTVALPA
ncbi:gamma carbonic anhydrase family protein [Arthrobacter globiformis]|uniref:gamma carbonic anhydrase family protein n=1 Tax=Arthrobacter globiformis TaxID=1665 RepID=UPI0027877D11|nr:gamma carbonic anhydrase family protein [Arthrobacter globiformis]MDQ0862853.1 carbonic anhydrase/acetyltransferase-like protein (isoleucine patch superfamily) [Arthrobacter globiformis]